MLQRRDTLPEIRFVDVGAAFPMATLEAGAAQAHALLDAATKGMPLRVLAGLDRVSRAWLQRNNSLHLPEIDAIAAKLARPGAYFLSVNYEWGCTCRVAPSADGRSARLVRVLDWLTTGLGRNIMAARVDAAAGAFVALTWPGYTGVLQAVARGRFAAALNQAPMRRAGGGMMPLDWAINKGRVWRTRSDTPAHVLRTVFEQAPTYAAARQLLIDTPIAAPAIFSLAGIHANETCVIERLETAAHVHDGPGVAANNWQAPGWHGRARGSDSAGRACLMAAVVPEFDATLPWLRPPILNSRTRLVIIADASSGEFLAQGFEAEGAATSVLQAVV
jgi:hypothetical protein